MPTFAGTFANEIFTGGPENDNLSGGGGADTLIGGGGDDVLYSGGVGFRFVSLLYDTPFNPPSIDEGLETDSLVGGDGVDTLFAGYGDHVDGGNGVDLLYISFRGAPTGVTADFSLPVQTIGGGVITGIEAAYYMEGSEYGDRLTFGSSYGGPTGTVNGIAVGRGGNDTVTAGYFTLAIYGDEGDDVLDGRPAGPYLMWILGGSGNDTLYDSQTSGSTLSGGDGSDTLNAYGVAHGEAGDDLIHVLGGNRSRAYGDDGNDLIIASGGASPSVLVGGAGADTLMAGGGGDLLYSSKDAGQPLEIIDDMGLDRDSLNGGAGNDTISSGYGDNVDGGAGVDSLRLSLGGASVGLDFNASSVIGGAPFSIGGGAIQNIEALAYLRGTEFSDTLRLASQAQQLRVEAGAGDDVIIAQASSVAVFGGAGNDRFVSGVGANTFDGGDGIDTVDYSAFTSGVTVNLRTGVGAGGDTLTNIENIIGSNFDDTLISATSLASGSVGRSAGSSLWGGAGADLFLVAQPPTSGISASQTFAVTVNDFASGDRVQFGTATGAYTELTAGSFAAAQAMANGQAVAGYSFVSIQVGSDVFVFGNVTESLFTGQKQFGDAVRLIGVGLDAVSASNVGLPGPLVVPVTPTVPNTPTPPVTPTLPVTPTAPPVTPTAPVTPTVPSPDITLPAAAPFVQTGVNGNLVIDIRSAHLAPLDDMETTFESDTVVNGQDGSGLTFHMEGYGFSTATVAPTGVITLLSLQADAAHGGPYSVYLTVPSIPLVTWAAAVVNDATFDFFSALLTGNDRIVGGGKELWTFGGDDLIYTNAGTETVWAGAGNDVIDARAPGPTVHYHYLRGEDGDDYFLGGNGFDDINGNRGRDTASGGNGDDWVVGGQDDDLLFGDNGFDIVYGNLGNDTVSGGNGNDWVRGGQGDDVLLGGAGNDFMSGDRGNDTIWGGAGADQFNVVFGASVDRVMDFSAAEGDFVSIEGGLAYTLTFVGGDAIIDIGNGDRMTLVGISSAAQLGPNWLH